MLDAKQQTGKYSYPYLANFNVQWFNFNVDNLNQMDFNEAEQKEFELRDGDLLVCEGGEIGRCAVWHNEIQPCFFQKALHRVRCNRGGSSIIAIMADLQKLLEQKLLSRIYRGLNSNNCKLLYPLFPCKTNSPPLWNV